MQKKQSHILSYIIPFLLVSTAVHAQSVSEQMGESYKTDKRAYPSALHRSSDGGTLAITRSNRGIWDGVFNFDAEREKF